MQVSLIGAMNNFLNEVQETQGILSPSGLIVQDMLNLFAHGDKGRCEMLVKDESTLHHMKTIKYALEGTLSAKVVSDTVKLLINENDETLEVLKPSKELIQALNEEKQKIIQGE